MADRILVTGANGFIGSALCRHLRESGFLVRQADRVPGRLPPGSTSRLCDLEHVLLHDRSTEAGVRRVLQNVQTVVHLAARVHVMSEHAADPLAEFRQVNLVWTEQLARLAASQGIRRFVYMSSVKVNGEGNVRPFTEDDVPYPQDPYGVSKWEAEQALARISAETAMETVIVRAPLVYGPDVEGNFLQLLHILNSGIPLPLAAIKNQRSFIYRGNLIDALICCVRDQRAVGQTYLVSDGEDLSTPDLIRRLGNALGRTVRLWPVPLSVLRWIGLVTRKQAVIERLVGSLQVDSSKIRRELDWRPPFTVEAGFSETAAWFRARPSLCMRS